MVILVNDNKNSKCFELIKETVQLLFSRFPEMDFILHHCSFVLIQHGESINLEE